MNLLYAFNLSKKYYFNFYASCGSTHLIEFAKQIHKNRGRVPRFLYFKREKVSEWELSDVRVLRSQNTDCRKNEVFRQSQHPSRFFLTGVFVVKLRFRDSYQNRARIFAISLRVILPFGRMVPSE